MNRICDCWVGRATEEQFSLRRGAHCPNTCGRWAVSADPVDRENDEETHADNCYCLAGDHREDA